jgi:hypothetical protein
MLIVLLGPGHSTQPAVTTGSLAVGADPLERQEYSSVQRDVGYQSPFCNGLRMTRDAHDAGDAFSL